MDLPTELARRLKTEAAAHVDTVFRLATDCGPLVVFSVRAIAYHDGEIADARWFHFREMPNVPGGTAISRWLIDAFIAEMSARQAGGAPPKS